MSALLMRFDTAQLRAAFGQFPTGVAVMTTRTASGELIGVTANSFTSVSLDPPLILWCLSRQAPSAAHFAADVTFAVNVLAADQAQLSRQFARPAPDKFAGASWTAGPDGVPLLDGVSAAFVCRARAPYAGGDHDILVGEVLDYRRSPVEPLLFHAGGYRRMAAMPR